MLDKIDSAEAVGAVNSHGSKLLSRTVAATIADAWRRYPAEVPIQWIDGGDTGLVRKVLGLFAQAGVVQLADNSVAVTASGHETVQQAVRRDERLSECLHSGSLPAEDLGSTPLEFAILRAHFERRNGSADEQ